METSEVKLTEEEVQYLQTVLGVELSKVKRALAENKMTDKGISIFTRKKENTLAVLLKLKMAQI